jgi:hypothetical protein
VLFINCAQESGHALHQAQVWPEQIWNMSTRQTTVLHIWLARTWKEGSTSLPVMDMGQ